MEANNEKNDGITLIALVITIVVLVILAGVAIKLTLGENGIFNKATEKLNLKITNIQMKTYSQRQLMPTLQELADELCTDNEIEYVELNTKKTATIDKVIVGENENIYTKLKDYPYEFEINSSLQLASIDGIKVADNNTTTNQIGNLITNSGNPFSVAFSSSGNHKLTSVPLKKGTYIFQTSLWYALYDQNYHTRLYLSSENGKIVTIPNSQVDTANSSYSTSVTGMWLVEVTEDDNLTINIYTQLSSYSEYQNQNHGYYAYIKLK